MDKHLASSGQGSLCRHYPGHVYWKFIWVQATLTLEHSSPEASWYCGGGVRGVSIFPVMGDVTLPRVHDLCTSKVKQMYLG